MAFLRLGLPLPLPQPATSCECGKPLDKKGYHLITCKIGGGPVWSHNSMVSAWSECLNQVVLTRAIEPRDCYSSSQARPDITIYNATATDFNVELDISLAHGVLMSFPLQRSTKDQPQLRERRRRSRSIAERNMLASFPLH